MRLQLNIICGIMAYLGCSDSNTGSSIQPIISGDCVQPADHGAFANDSQDDRKGLQIAITIAVAGTRCISLVPNGIYNVTRNPQPGASGIPSLNINGRLEIIGNNAKISMMGSGIRPGEDAPGDWVLLQVHGAEDVIISNVNFDGTIREFTEEQTHLVQLKGPTNRVLIQNSTFNLPGPMAAGDCIRLLGSFKDRVANTIIQDIYAPSCFRSFIGVQKGVDFTLVQRAETVWVGDQVIDSEITGVTEFNCAPAATEFTVKNSVFRRDPNTSGINMAFAGRDCSIIDQVTIEDTIIEGGGIDILDAGDVILSRLHIRSGKDTNNQATVLARKRVTSLTIKDTVIVNEYANQPSIQISAQSSAKPNFALLSNVSITQKINKPGLLIEGLSRLIVKNSEFIYTGSQGTAVWAISGAADFTTISDTKITGGWRGINNRPMSLIRTQMQ